MSSPHHTKVCCDCGESKPLVGFHRDKTSRDGRSYSCKVCACERSARWRRENYERALEGDRKWRESEAGKESIRKGRERYNDTERGRLVNLAKARRSRRRRFYGMTEDEYEVFTSVDCAICGRNKKENVQMHVDHDHVTGAIRDALCANCNQGLGNFRDRPDLLLIAAEYLRLHGASAE